MTNVVANKAIITDRMNIIKTDIDSVLIIEPRLFRDARGNSDLPYFSRNMQADGKGTAIFL